MDDFLCSAIFTSHCCHEDTIFSLAKQVTLLYGNLLTAINLRLCPNGGCHISEQINLKKITLSSKIKSILHIKGSQIGLSVIMHIAKVIFDS